ncbi:hypothetical protein KW843_22765 [Acidovorax sp. sif1233]|uniref:hypothetical protein n=1 Tax=Acidovorax sp. sif1233 TaxID=2854792 RepID=UPI001C450CF0|nr:hypothetical protein [Acidovorax sp. sif1233]MBV7457321.1 hypothetical protein [Acidovorax sp. sif1233]
MPPKSTMPPSLEAIEERVNAVINSAMSRAISERDRLVQSYQGATKAADALFERMKVIEHRLARVEHGAASVEAGALQAVENLKVEVGTVRSILAKVYDRDAEQYATMVGKRVCIVGGTQVMVAAGLDDDGQMVCVFERPYDGGAQITSVAVPATVLVLLPSPETSAPAAKSARKTRSSK